MVEDRNPSTPVIPWVFQVGPSDGGRGAGKTVGSAVALSLGTAASPLEVFPFIGISAVATLIVSKGLPRSYESTVSVDVDRRVPTGVMGQEATQSTVNDGDEFLATQVSLFSPTPFCGRWPSNTGYASSRTNRPLWIRLARRKLQYVEETEGNAAAEYISASDQLPVRRPVSCS